MGIVDRYDVLRCVYGYGIGDVRCSLGKTLIPASWEFPSLDCGKPGDHGKDHDAKNHDANAKLCVCGWYV